MFKSAVQAEKGKKVPPSEVIREGLRRERC